MGCEIKWEKDFVEVEGKPLKAIDVDMKNCPDIVIPLAVTCSFAKGVSCFRNISHLRFKECDRAGAVKTELNKMGIRVDLTHEDMFVYGGNPVSATIETYKDHRMAMAFSIAGLKIPNMIIKNPENVNKSFPKFYEVLKKLK
jgi:3-phosphoshikimate 1-carboxyvinyltransferase